MKNLSGDWVSTAKQDLTDLNIKVSFEEIENISKEAFKKLVKDKVHKSALDYLKNLQLSHSKSENLSYDDLSLQGYLKSGTSNMTIRCDLDHSHRGSGSTPSNSYFWPLGVLPVLLYHFI